MPMMTSVTPQSVAASTMVFMPPIMDSQPSRPKRLAVLNLVARTFSNFSAKARRSRTCVRSSSVSGFRGTSMRDRSQFCLQRFVMCSASTPTVPQYLCGTQIYGAFVLDRRVDRHALDANDPTHWLISTQRGTCRGGSRRARRASSGRRRSRPRCRGGRRPVWKSNLRRVRPESPRRGAPDALVDFHTAGDRRPGRGGEPERPVGVARLEAVVAGSRSRNRAGRRRGAAGPGPRARGRAAGTRR